MMDRWRFRTRTAATLLGRIVEHDSVTIVCKGWDAVGEWTVVMTGGTINVGGSQDGGDGGRRNVLYVGSAMAAMNADHQRRCS